MLKFRQSKWYKRIVWMGALMIGGLLVACGGKTEETEEEEDNDSVILKSVHKGSFDTKI